MGILTTMPNIGAELEKQLHDIGIHTPNTLKQTGSRESWLKIQKIDSIACIHRLYALEGAILNIKKKDLPQATKDDLKAFYQKHKL